MCELLANGRAPQVPRSKTAPVGQTRRIERVIREITADLRQVIDEAVDELLSWPVSQANTVLGNRRYEFAVGLDAIQRLVERLEARLAKGRGAAALRKAAEDAYREGVAKTVENLHGISSDFPHEALRRLGDQLVLRRAALVGTRAFELMEGMAGDTGAELRRILFDAVLSGENPRNTAKTIRERLGIRKSRAERIARTEITMAHRRGRWDEAREAEQKFGIRIKLLHVSALIPGRTRITHAERHGNLYTREEVAEWYSRDGNAINCLCSQSEVVIGEDGEPVTGGKLIERMQQARRQFLQVVAPERVSSKPAVRGLPPLIRREAHGALDNMPDYLLRAIARVGDPSQVRRDPTMGPYFDFADRSINMGALKPGSDKWKQAFRHELGHFLDREMRDLYPEDKRFLVYASAREGVEPLAEDGKELIDAYTGVDTNGRMTAAQRAEVEARKEAILKEYRELAKDFRLRNKPPKTVEELGQATLDLMNEILKGEDITAEELLALYKVERPSQVGELLGAKAALAWKNRDIAVLTQELPETFGLGLRDFAPASPLQDTFEAANPKGWRMWYGHGYRYYDQALPSITRKINGRVYSARNTTEAFANWVEAQGDPAAARMFRHLFPRTDETFRRMVELFVNLDTE